MDDNKVLINDEQINKKLSMQQLEEYAGDESFKNNVRKVTDLGGAMLNTNEQLSIEKTQLDTEIVDRLINNLVHDEIEVDKKELKQARLEAIKERNIAHIMVNSRKSGGDSPEMIKVKKAVEKVERAITAQYGDAFNEQNMETIQESYNEAIDACQKYLKKKGSFINAWKYRKDMVQKTMDRLLRENKLITTGKALFALEKPKEPIRNGLELMTVARMYELSNDMRTIKHERKYHIEKKVVGGFLFFGGEEVEEKVYDEEEKTMDKIDKVSTQDMVSKFGSDTYTMLDFLQNDSKKALSSFTARGRKFKNFSKDEKTKVYEVRKIREILSRFYRDEVNTSIIKIGGTFGNVIQRDDNSVYIEMKGVKIPLGKDSKQVLHDMEDDVIANLDKYEDKDVLSVFENMYINYKEMSAGDLIRMRNAFSVVIARQTGIKRTDFDNLSVESLKEFATMAVNGVDVKKSVNNAIRESLSTEKKHINNMLTLELSKLSKQEKELVDYIPPNKYKNILTGEINEKNEDIERGWSYHEASVKKLATDFIFDPESTEADFVSEVNEKEKEKFKKDYEAERTAKIRKEVIESYEADQGKVDEKDKELMKVINNAVRNLTNESRDSDPVTDDKYLDYKRGLRLKEVLKKNVDGIAALLSDVYRDKTVKPVSFLEAMMDKLPLFVVDEGMNDMLKKQISSAMTEVAKFLDEQIDMESLGENKDAAISAIRMCLGPVKDMISQKLDELDMETIAKLGSIQGELDSAVESAADNIQEMMSSCTDIVFGKKKEEKEEDKEQKKDDNAEENKEQKKDDNVEEEELEGFAALEQIMAKMKVEENAKEWARSGDEFANEWENLTEEEKNLMWEQNAPFRIKKLKKNVSDRAQNRKDLNKNKSTAQKRLKAATKSGNREAINQAKEALEEVEKTIKKDIEDQKKSLDKAIEDTVKGTKGQGLYIKNVMKGYFKGMPLMDKRSMIANAIKNARPVEKPSDEDLAKLSDEQKMEYFSDILGGLFKGAGPLFQKMLQGLPTSAIPKGLAKAIDEMKDSLLPIPEKVIKQQLEGVIKRSQGRVESIKVEKSLGAASVGQAFLCTLKGPGYPEEGKKVVIKLLRPDVRNRMKREYNVMREAAKKTDKGMLSTFEGTFKRVEEELDLTIEARHVVEGEVYNKKSENFDENRVKSMKLSKVTDPTADCMIIELAEGTTVKRYLSDKRNVLENIMDKYYMKEKDENGKEVVMKDAEGKPRYIKDALGSKAYHAIKDKLELHKQLQDLEKRQDYLLELADKWVTEGVFGKGFYHGDLHAGNIMIDEKGVTVIDFGNCTQLTKEQQDNITKMMLAAATGEVDVFLDGFKALLENTSEEDYEKRKTELRAIFKDVLTTGDKNCAAQRIAVALVRAQEIGLELPSAVANFSSCQIRLQNTIDDTNKLIKDLRTNIEELDKLGVDYDYEPVLKDETFTELFYKYKDGNASEKLRKLKDARFAEGGISREDFFKELNTKNKGDRIMFMVKNMGTPSMLLDMMDIECKANKGAYYRDLYQFLVTKCDEDDYELEADIFRDCGFKLTKGAFDFLMRNFESIYNKMELPLSDKLDPKTGKHMHVKNVREALDKIANFELDEVVGEDVVKHKVDLRHMFEKNDLDKALDAYLKAVDAKDPLPEEEMKKLEDKVWEEYNKREAKADENFKNDPANQYKFRKTHHRNNFVIASSFSYVMTEEGASKEQIQRDIESNKKAFINAKKTVTPYFEDDKYGEALKSKVEQRQKMMDKMEKYLVEGKGEPVKEEDFEKIKQEIADLAMQAKVHMIDGLIEEHKKVGYPKEMSKKDPKDFMDVMSDVIDKYRVTAAKKFGYIKSLMYQLDLKEA